MKNKTNKVELLAPAGDIEKLQTALHFGADAVYLGGSSFGLRAYAGNFDNSGLQEAVKLAHDWGARVYVTANIFARDAMFAELNKYFAFLQDICADGVIVSDLGVLQSAKKYAPKIEIHISTQAGVTNAEAANAYAALGASRVILARECTLEQVKYIAKHALCQTEVFVHGAMCVSFSGRCLLSDYYTQRKSNLGECVQACRWKYGVRPLEIFPVDNAEQTLELYEDKEGSYLLNSKDLNMLNYLSELVEGGVSSLKIEGRMKSPYYLATVVNAYRRALDGKTPSRGFTERLQEELDKASHRSYTSGFYFEDKGVQKQFYQSSRTEGSSRFVAVVKGCETGRVTVEMRNRFYEGETLEVLSPLDTFAQKIIVANLVEEGKGKCADAKNVQGIYSFDCPLALCGGDILRGESLKKDYNN